MTTEAQKQYEKMTGAPVGKLIVSLSVLTIISMLVSSIYNMADTYFVSSLGTSASAATGVVMGLMSILQAVGFMFGHGAGSNISRKLGARKIEEAREYASTGFYYAVGCGLIILVIGLAGMRPLMRLLGSTDTIFPYARDYAFWILIAGPALTCNCVMNNILRYEGRAMLAMIGLTIGGILNIFGDAYMINVLHMGVKGAGISTAVSQYISMGILLLPFIMHRTQSRFSLRAITKRGEVVKNIISCGMPSLARQGLNSASMMLMNHAAGLYGDAAISIVNRIVQFLFCIAIGIGQGLQPVSAFNFGAAKYKRVKAATNFTMRLGIGLMAILGVIGRIYAANLIALFRDDPAVLAIGLPTLRYQCLILWMMPITMYGNMLFQATGQGKIATFLAALRSGIILIPLLFLLNTCFGLGGLEVAQAASEMISAVICLPFFHLFYRRLPQDGKPWQGL